MLFAQSRWRLTLEAVGAATLVRLHGTAIQIHSHDVEQLRPALLRLAEAATEQHLILDLGNVDFLSSETIEVLLALSRRLRSQGGRLSVYRPTPVVAEIFAVMRLTTLLDVRRSLPGSQTGET
jgi:anti-anti-sigma factor